MDAWVWGVIVAAAAAVVLVVLIAWIASKRRRSGKLREGFGPEYERTVTEHGSKKKAEAELKARQERVEKLQIRPLSSEDQGRFGQRWTDAQGRFVDDPAGAITEADRLVDEVMQVRGYPVGDFDQRAADVSVDHPQLVQNYRAANEISEQSANGKATTEQLRQAMVHYRSLFQELLETGDVETDREEASRR